MIIAVDLKNCYGIKSLQHRFDFSEARAIIIYAPNGAMKTSLAKVFTDLSTNRSPSDVIFPSRPTQCSVTADPALPLDTDHVFVVDPYEEGFASNRMATLLVNEELKRKYQAIHASIDKAKADLMAGIGDTSHLKKKVEPEMLAAFRLRPGDIYSLLDRFEPQVTSDVDANFTDIEY